MHQLDSSREILSESSSIRSSRTVYSDVVIVLNSANQLCVVNNNVVILRGESGLVMCTDLGSIPSVLVRESTMLG